MFTIVLLIFLFSFLGIYVLGAVVDIGSHLLGFYIPFKSTIRIIGRLALLLVAVGFFMPVGCETTGFNFANNALNAESINIAGLILYCLFVISLLGGLLLIPILMNLKINLLFDWISSLVPIVCAIYLAVEYSGFLSSLLTGGYLIIIGLFYSFLTIAAVTLFPEKKVVNTVI